MQVLPPSLPPSPLSEGFTVCVTSPLLLDVNCLLLTADVLATSVLMAATTATTATTAPSSVSHTIVTAIEQLAGLCSVSMVNATRCCRAGLTGTCITALDQWPVEINLVFSPRICSRTLMGYSDPHQCSLGTAACYLLVMLTCAVLMTSSHSEGRT